MRKEYTAIIERRRGNWYVAHCVEIPGATGQGPTEEAAQKSLEEAISLVLKDRLRETGSGEGSEEEDERVVH